MTLADTLFNQNLRITYLQFTYCDSVEIICTRNCWHYL